MSYKYRASIVILASVVKLGYLSPIGLLLIMIGDENFWIGDLRLFGLACEQALAIFLTIGYSLKNVS